MRHKYKGRKLGTDYSHTKAMKVSLVQALFLNDRIKTTETRAKEIRRNVDKLITWAKKGDLHSRRLAIAALGNNSDLVREIFEKVQQGMFKDRPGGYTRIMKLGPRKGDGAPMVIIELVNETCVPKAEKKAAKAAPAKKKATPSKKKKDDAEEKESILEEMKEDFEAAEETFAENVREEGEEQLAEEKAEVAAEDAAAEAKAEGEKADNEAEAEKAEEKAHEESDREAEEAKEEAEEAEAEAAEEAKAESEVKEEDSEKDGDPL